MSRRRIRERCAAPERRILDARRTALAASLAAVLASASLHAAEPLPDPTRPPASARVDARPAAPVRDEALVLHAIFHADDRRIAVINGRRVRVAESIGDARVLAIEIDRVRLRRGDEIVELELVSPAFKNARLAQIPTAPPAAVAAGDAGSEGEAAAAVSGDDEGDGTDRTDAAEIAP